jgi:hypothetical protein
MQEIVAIFDRVIRPFREQNVDTHWAGAWGAVRRLFGGPEPRQALAESAWHPSQVHPGRSERRRGKRTGELDPRTFVSVCSGLSMRDGRARLHLFSLGDFRKAAGEKWTRLESLVNVATSQIIRRHIDPYKDLFTHLDSETACLLMPGKDQHAAHAMVNSIARDISHHLFGAGLVGMRRPHIITADVPVLDVFGPKANHGHDTIKVAIATASRAAGVTLASADRAALAAMLAPDDGPAAFAISGGNRPLPADEPLWSEIRPHSRMETLRVDGPTMGGELGVMRVDGLTMGGELGVMHVDGPTMGGELGVMRIDGPTMGGELEVMHVEGRGPRAEERVMRIDGRPRSGLNSQSMLSLAWTPTWVTSAGRVGAFHARVIRVDGEDAPRLSGVQAYADIAPVERLTLDRFVTTKAADELKTLFYSRQRTGLTIPIHWTSLAPQWADVVRMPMEACPVQARRRLLKIEIFGLTPDMPKHIARKLAERLEKIGCDVLVRLPLSSPEMISVLGPVKAIGVDLAELDDHERITDKVLMSRLAAFRDVARQARTACYVWNVPRRTLVSAVAKAGFSLINGPGVMGDVPRPHPTRQ